MKKVLLTTVGGSADPVVKSIEENKPDYVVFFCSEDNATQKGSAKTITETDSGNKNPAIAVRAGLNEGQYEIVIVKPDNPWDTFAKASERISHFQAQQAKITVDYTGGTKSMGLGAGAAAMINEGCELTVVAGNRHDLIKIKPGMEFLRSFPENQLQLRVKSDMANALFATLDYAGCEGVLAGILLKNAEHDGGVTQQKLYISRVLHLWDCFQYEEAQELLARVEGDRYKKLLGSLKQVIGALKWFDRCVEKPENTKQPILVVAYDVLKNAERRAKQEKYEDAMSRVYRAVEMYGQFCLMNGTPQLYNSDLNISLLPEERQADYAKLANAKGKVQIALVQTYKLLDQLNHPVGEVFSRHEEELKWVLEKRNYSFLAHGTVPVNKEEWKKVHKIVWKFICECDEAMQINCGLKSIEQWPDRL